MCKHTDKSTKLDSASAFYIGPQLLKVIELSTCPQCLMTIKRVYISTNPVKRLSTAG